MDAIDSAPGRYDDWECTKRLVHRRNLVRRISGVTAASTAVTSPGHGAIALEPLAPQAGGPKMGSPRLEFNATAD